MTLAPAIDRTARVERLAFDAILRPTELLVLPGGKGVNTCRAARLMGADVATTGICGGHAGRWLVDALQRERLGPHFVEVDAETRTTYVTIDDGGRSVLVYEPSPAVSPEALEKLIKLLDGELLPRTEWLVCSGSLPPGLGTDAYARLARAARAAQRHCLIDTGGVALERSLAEGPDVVKVSLHEAREALGGPAHSTARRLSERLVERGAKLAVVTDGARGASASDSRRSWAVRVPRVRAVNPIGAGDVFNAAFVVALAAAAPIEEALRRAAAAATASTFELGAGALDPRRAAEIEHQVAVHEVTHGTL